MIAYPSSFNNKTVPFNNSDISHPSFVHTKLSYDKSIQLHAPVCKNQSSRTCARLIQLECGAHNSNSNNDLNLIDKSDKLLTS